ncbi:MAG: methylglyoxal synthase [Cellvibrio sp.]
MEFKKSVVPAKKVVALVAHDNKKTDLVNWCKNNASVLAEHKLFATGTTGKVIKSETGLDVTPLLSGPLGGDQQIGAMITEGKADVLIFFWDPFEPMPHDPDVKALLRIAAVWNIPVACNQSSADFLITSPLFNSESPRDIPDYEAYMIARLQSRST